MSGMFFLESSDFFVQEGNSGKILSNQITGFSLILFYSTNCSHCQSLIPIFKKLPGTFNGCSFGMLNVSKNHDIIQKSQQTISPIKYVPYIVLYVNGTPHMLYKGPYNIQDITNFVIEVSNNIQKKQQFSKEKVKDVPGELATYGIPLKGNDKVCYLEYQTAYEEQKR